MPTIMIGGGKRENQCKKPSGWVGRIILWRMNRHHSQLTDWGLGHVAIGKDFVVLDVGCGGGRTLAKLAARAAQGKVCGLDYSEASVAASRRLNARAIREGRVEVRQGSVSQLPFEGGRFDLVTAVETHFWWPDLAGDLREIWRVLKPGGTLLVVAEVYQGANTKLSQMAEETAPKTGIKILSVQEHRDLFAQAGFAEVQVIEEPLQGWLCALGKKS